MLQPDAHADELHLVEAGIPAFSREWTGNDCARAAEVLAEGKVPLPQFANSEGKQFLERLTSTENFSFHRNQTIPIGMRLEDFMKLIGASSSIVKQYAVAANKRQNVYAETIQVLAFMLRAASLGVQLLDEFVPTIPKDDKYETRMAGLRQTQRGLMQMFLGAETSLSETNFYSSEDLSLLLEAMAETLPTVKKAFGPDFKLELRKKLELRRKAFPKKEDAANLEKLIKELGT